MKTYNITMEKTEGKLGLFKGKIETKIFRTKIKAENINSIIETLRMENKFCTCNEEYICGICYKQKGWTIKDGELERL